MSSMKPVGPKINLNTPINTLTGRDMDHTHTDTHTQTHGHSSHGVGEVPVLVW